MLLAVFLVAFLVQACCWCTSSFCVLLYKFQYFCTPAGRVQLPIYKTYSVFMSLLINHLARNAMTSLSIQVICTLLLVVAMASMAGPDAGPPVLVTVTPTVTLFVCVNCSATGHLSSSWLFLHRAGVQRHISASKACFAAGLCFQEIHVEARPCDIMAGAGGAAGPVTEVSHQPAGRTMKIYFTTMRN